MYETNMHEMFNRMKIAFCVKPPLPSILLADKRVPREVFGWGQLAQRRHWLSIKTECHTKYDMRLMRKFSLEAFKDVKEIKPPVVLFTLEANASILKTHNLTPVTRESKC